jgi:thioredoxin-like negative regulator of GroEL
VFDMSQTNVPSAPTLFLLTSSVAGQFGLPRTDIVAVAGRARLGVRCIDVDAHPEFAEMFDVVGYPALVVTIDGEVVARTEGAISGFELREWLFDNVTNTHVLTAA